jgi:hemoglobin-like flavoprotein
MTPEQIQTVQFSWVKVVPIKDTAAQVFCERLFETDPSLRGVFRGDMREQGAKFMQVIDAAVTALSPLERMVPLIRELGRRYAQYGVKEHHYRTVGAALLWTLEKGLGAEFTPKVKDAWEAVYGVLATAMRESAGAARVTNTIRAPQLDQRDAA